jgi:hypothetical protein
MVFASLRFDDALHTAPSTLTLSEGVLRGVCWQTKVSRDRKGTAWAVPDTSFGAVGWLEPWFHFARSLWHKQADFWLFSLRSDGAAVFTDASKPMLPRQGISAVRALLGTIPEDVSPSAQAFADIVTWHSARVTMIDMAGKAGRSATEMLLQMHSKSPAMVEKYQRSRLAIPIAMIRELCQGDHEASAGASASTGPEALEGQGLPSLPLPLADEHLGTVVPDADDPAEGDLPCFFVLPEDPGRSAADQFRLKYHVPSLIDDERAACQVLSVPIQGMIPMGVRCPRSRVCDRCLAARPAVSAQLL